MYNTAQAYITHLIQTLPTPLPLPFPENALPNPSETYSKSVDYNQIFQGKTRWKIDPYLLDSVSTKADEQKLIDSALLAVLAHEAFACHDMRFQHELPVGFDEGQFIHALAMVHDAENMVTITALGKGGWQITTSDRFRKIYPKQHCWLYSRHIVVAKKQVIYCIAQTQLKVVTKQLPKIDRFGNKV